MNRRDSALLEVRGLSKRFTDPGIVDAVRDVSFDLRAGEIAALVGPSGSGKSTLLAMLGGLLKPTSGTIVLDGEEITGMAPAMLPGFRNRKIGFVFQFHHLLPELTALENVMLPGLIAAREGWSRSPSASLKEKAMGLLSAVGLMERADHLPNQLSGGEAQRAALARALMNEPPVILADEPTGNLDSRKALELMDLFRELGRADSSRGFLIATHNPEIVNRAGRVLKLINGEMTG